MKIYIPTRGRPHIQRTYNNLSPKLQRDTYLVVDAGEEESYVEEGYPVIALPRDVKGIAPIRQFILEEIAPSIDKKDPYLCMLDDDLYFQTRRADMRINNNTSMAETNKAFTWLERQLRAGYAHASMSPRSIYYDKEDRFVKNFRMMHVLAYDYRRVLDAGCSFTKGVSAKFSMDDFHMTLQLLEKGYENIVSLVHRTNPSISNSKGGASEWRTLKSHNASAKALHRNHKDFVTVKEKHGWQGMEGTRLDVVIAWKKAVKYGQD